MLSNKVKWKESKTVRIFLLSFQKEEEIKGGKSRMEKSNLCGCNLA